MNSIHPKGAFGSEFEGQLFDLMVAGRPATPPQKQGRGVAFSTKASAAAVMEGFAKGKLVKVEHGRGTISGIKKADKPKRAKPASWVK